MDEPFIAEDNATYLLNVTTHQNRVKRAPAAAPAPAATTATTTTKRRKRRVRKKYEPEVRHYYEITDADVLCHRGGFANQHVGNKRYHAYKARLQPAYEAALKSQKRFVTQQLVDAVHAWGGRFLEQDADNEGQWFEIHEKKALTKASQALRENYTSQERAAKRERYRRKKELARQRKEEDNDDEDEDTEQEEDASLDMEFEQGQIETV